MTHVAGAAISSATELLPWPDAANLGDMFRAVSITFGSALGPDDTSSWMDDTDVTAVPEPTGIVLMGTGLLLLIRRSRQSTPRET